MFSLKPDVPGTRKATHNTAHHSMVLWPWSCGASVAFWGSLPTGGRTLKVRGQPRNPKSLLAFDALVASCVAALGGSKHVSSPVLQGTKNHIKKFVFFSSCFRSFVFGCLSASDHVLFFALSSPVCSLFSIFVYMFFVPCLVSAALGLGLSAHMHVHATLSLLFSCM